MKYTFDYKDKALITALTMYLIIVFVQVIISWITGHPTVVEGTIVSLALMILYKQYEREYDV